MSGMAVVMTKAFAFVTIIVMGYTLKRGGFFHGQDFFLLSKMVLKITLPAAIVSNFSKISMDASMLILCVMGLCCNVLTLTVGYIISAGKGRDRKVFAMLNLSGYNIGCFTMPFVQNFLGPLGVAVTSLFDAGNAVMCTGMNYTVASMVYGEEEKPSPAGIARSLLSSVPFDAYVVMTCLALAKIRLPQAVVTLADTVGGANAFLAMLMIGVGFEIRADREKIRTMIRLLSVRLATGLSLALGFFFLLPFPLEVRQAVCICVVGPVGSVAPAFVGRLNGDVELASAINSLSILMGVVTTTAALLIML